MKKFSLLIAACILFSCSDDDGLINYNRDEEELFDTMESLAALSNVSTFVGDLVIQSDDITSLASLRNLQVIDGYLVIDQTTDLETLEGLNNLTSVDGIVLYNNESLSNIDALGNISSVDFLQVYLMPALTSLDGLGQLDVERSILISSNPQLTEISEQITMNDGIAYNIYLAYNETLERAPFLDQIKETEWMWLNSNPVLNLDNDFNQLETVEYFYIDNNDGLTTIQLNNLKQVEDFDVEGNDKLESLTINGTTMLENDPVIVRDVRILDNSSLATISGFNQYSEAIIWIVNNQSLTSVSGFNQMERVSLVLEDNALLTTLDMFNDSAVELYDLRIIENASLDNYCGLNKMLESDFTNSDITINNNLYNPTAEMLSAGACSPN